MTTPRVLVTDDDQAVRAMCGRALRRQGYQVDEAATGEAALASVGTGDYDLLLTDLRMPGMGGLAACQEIRRRDPDLPIVIMTGYGTIESAIEALEIGVSEFLLKPFRPDELVAAVARALTKTRLERENARLKALIPIFDLSRVFMSSVDLQEIPRHVARLARRETGADQASVMLLTGDGHLAIWAAEGLADEVVQQTRQRADEGIAGYAIAQREPVVLHGSLEGDSRFTSHNSQPVGSAICLPLLHKDRVLGVLNVSRSGAEAPFTRGDVDLLSILGSQAAVAIENARLFADRERAYARLSELDHLKSEFINIASHELRAPLAVLLAYATLLEAQATGQMRDHLNQVVESAMRLKSVIDEMVSLQRIDTGQAQVTLAPVDLAPVLRRVAGEHAALAASKQLALSLSLPDDLPLVSADEQVVGLIVGNLVSNAVKFTPEGGAVTVEACQEGGRVLVTVRDTGVGIAAENLERIFERFYQVEESLSREHGGIGLGLAIARAMAELVDGSIHVESELGKGSAFHLSLVPAGSGP
jgi:signal transduction histidine kinase/DNA-binding response OmpR family regulator